MASYTNTEMFRTGFYPTADDETLERYIQRAADFSYNVINSYHSGIFTVPFVEVASHHHPIVVDISDFMTKGIVAALQLSSRTGMLNVEEEGGEIELAMNMIKDIRMGIAEILDWNGDLIPRLDVRGAWHSMAGVMHIFDLDDSIRHLPDEDYLEALERDRENRTI